MKRLKSGIAEGVENIIFDLGGVLLDIDPRRTVEAFEKLNLAELEAEKVHPNNYGVFMEFEVGAISPDEFVERLKGYIPNGNPSGEAIVEAWNAMLLEYDWQRFGLLDELRESGYRLFLLSNTNVLHRECFLEKFDREHPAGRSFESYFDTCFYSDLLGLRKPGEEIYGKVLEEAGLEAGKTLFIDDNSPNTDAARKVGLQAYHLVSPESVLDLFEPFR